VSLTWQQPLVNIARTAIEAMAAVMGGCQSLHTNSYDEALALPTEEAVQIAMRTQQVIAYETGVTNTIDPLGGSYFVEEMTNRIEAQAYEYFARMDELGGTVEAVKQNFQMREIAEASFAWQQEVEAGERRIVGVNAYQVQDEPEVAIHTIDPKGEVEQAQRVRDARAGRDEDAAQRALAALTEAARGDANLMYPLVECARATCTEGEIVRALRTVFGSWTETPVF
jgi:methylmalonyl-CoA mutase N-terminal domain/subunit